MNSKMMAMLEESRSSGKGVTLYLPGSTVAIVVSDIDGTGAVTGRNREYDQVVVRLDQVIGCAMN